MSDVNDLVARIEGAFTAVKERVQKAQQQELQRHQDRHQRLKEYEKVQARIIEAAKPRLEALARRAGDRASVAPSVIGNRRSVRFEFKSAKAAISLSFWIAPDREIENAVVECDLKIIPVLWKFDSHAEFGTPVAAPDVPALIRWLDDRIIGFVELFIQINEGELYDKADYVEDPIAKVKFPKFAAGASLEHQGQTYFFIDENTKSEFARQNRIA